MTTIRAGLIQLSSSDDPTQNTARMEVLVRQAAADGATLIVTPEVSNIVSASRSHQNAVLTVEADDQTLARMRELADELSIWLLIGSLALKSDKDTRFLNRSFLIGPDGRVMAHYDKIHMFDVQLGGGEAYKESSQFQPGERAVVTDTGFGKIGMTICYDLRFAHLHRVLAKAGADILTVPAAFTVPTGQAHWEVLLRARAIETGCFVLAPAQCGTHSGGRKTYGHSIAIDPWGTVISQADKVEGVTFADLDLSLVAEARRKIPALTHDRSFGHPDDNA